MQIFPAVRSTGARGHSRVAVLLLWVCVAPGYDRPRLYRARNTEHFRQDNLTGIIFEAFPRPCVPSRQFCPWHRSSISSRNDTCLDLHGFDGVQIGGLRERGTVPRALPLHHQLLVHSLVPAFLALSGANDKSVFWRLDPWQTRLTEFMKIMGLRSSVHWLGWFLTKLALITVTVTLLTLIMVSGNIIQFSDPLILWLLLMLYGVSTILFAFVVSTFFGSARLASACGGLLYVLPDCPALLVFGLLPTVS